MGTELVRKPTSANNGGELDSTTTQVIPGAKTFTGALTPSGGIVGRTDGQAVPAGMVGEKISASLATISQASPVSLTWYDDSGTLTLPAGNWIIYSTANVSGVNPGGISGAVTPLTGFGLRTGSTVLKETIVSAGQVNGVTFMGLSLIHI